VTGSGKILGIQLKPSFGGNAKKIIQFLSLYYRQGTNHRLFSFSMPKISSKNSQVFPLSLKVFSIEVFSNLNVKHQRLEFATSYRNQQLQALAGLHSSSVAVFSGGVLFRLIFVFLNFDPSNST